MVWADECGKVSAALAQSGMDVKVKVSICQNVFAGLCSHLETF